MVKQPQLMMNFLVSLKFPLFGHAKKSHFYIEGFAIQFWGDRSLLLSNYDGILGIKICLDLIRTKK